MGLVLIKAIFGWKVYLLDGQKLWIFSLVAYFKASLIFSYSVSTVDSMPEPESTLVNRVPNAYKNCS